MNWSDDYGEARKEKVVYYHCKICGEPGTRWCVRCFDEVTDEEPRPTDRTSEPDPKADGKIPKVETNLRPNGQGE